MPGRINVIDLGLIPEDLPFGELSAVAGDAAYHYIRVASELAMARRGAGHLHRARSTRRRCTPVATSSPGTPSCWPSSPAPTEVSMMLSTPRVQVIHVTTHIGLIDAVERIEPGLVERTIRRGHEALVDAGNAEPQDRRVRHQPPRRRERPLRPRRGGGRRSPPASPPRRPTGSTSVGPLPADTLFFLAGRGDYDLVVAMYHDQGHGPVKVLGLEAGVNITVGLPVIRTSVDHGTAFDIAGKGIADHRSMVEALRLAARDGAERRDTGRPLTPCRIGCATDGR